VLLARVFHESVIDDGANLTGNLLTFQNLAAKSPNMLKQAKAEEKRTPGHGEPRGTKAQLPRDSYPRNTLEKILTLFETLELKIIIFESTEVDLRVASVFVVDGTQANVSFWSSSLNKKYTPTLFLRP
jgi:hypothetical protein